MNLDKHFCIDDMKVVAFCSSQYYAQVTFEDSRKTVVCFQ